MIRCKVKEISEYIKETTFINAKCGHKQVFKYSTPYLCQRDDCTEKLASVTKLYGSINQDERVKYFVEGKI